MRWRSKQAVSVPGERKIEQFAHRSRRLVGSRRNHASELADGKRSGKTMVMRRKRSAVTDELRGRDLRKDAAARKEGDSWRRRNRSIGVFSGQLASVGAVGEIARGTALRSG